MPALRLIKALDPDFDEGEVHAQTANGVLSTFFDQIRWLTQELNMKTPLEDLMNNDKMEKRREENERRDARKKKPKTVLPKVNVKKKKNKKKKNRSKKEEL